jgi:hypothetical protein
VRIVVAIWYICFVKLSNCRATFLKMRDIERRMEIKFMIDIVSTVSLSSSMINPLQKRERTVLNLGRGTSSEDVGRLSGDYCGYRD